MRKLSNIMVTGGAGFIGSNFVRYLFEKAGFDGRVVNVDKLTYAGNLENLADISSKFLGKRYFFEKADIADHDAMKDIARRHEIDTIVNFAAESHVDRSICGPKDFIQTNIVGTFSLLEAVREVWNGRDDVLFHHISTDEVYGSLSGTGSFSETTPYDPRSPYSASKAGSDHLVKAYHHTYGLPVTLSNCSNNYGPYQFPEKLIPLMILNMKDSKPLPVYGDGKNVRDWIHVDDHNSAVMQILCKGRTGQTYNVGGENEWENIKLVHLLCDIMGRLTEKSGESYKKLISFISDRLGHDRRYAIDSRKIRDELGWKPATHFESGIEETIKWYLKNGRWIENVRADR